MAEVQPSSPAPFEASGDISGKTCSICQTVIISGEQVVACPFCALPFHHECWKENRGCSAYGCEGAPKTTKAAATVDPVSNAWGDEKPCPSCGKSIKAQALKCRFCGASFETRDLVSKDDYSRREYDGAEYTAVRNKLIALFVLSATGCLSPFTLIIASVLIVRKNLMDIDYNRLSSTMKAIVFSAAAVSALLMFILVLTLVFD